MILMTCLTEISVFLAKVMGREDGQRARMEVKSDLNINMEIFCWDQKLFREDNFSDKDMELVLSFWEDVPQNNEEPIYAWLSKLILET